MALDMDVAAPRLKGLHVHAQVACEAQKPGPGGPSTGWMTRGRLEMVWPAWAALERI